MKNDDLMVDIIKRIEAFFSSKSTSYLEEDHRLAVEVLIMTGDTRSRVLDDIGLRYEIKDYGIDIDREDYGLFIVLQLFYFRSLFANEGEETIHTLFLNNERDFMYIRIIGDETNYIEILSPVLNQITEPKDNKLLREAVDKHPPVLNVIDFILLISKGYIDNVKLFELHNKEALNIAKKRCKVRMGENDNQFLGSRKFVKYEIHKEALKCVNLMLVVENEEVVATEI